MIHRNSAFEATSTSMSLATAYTVWGKTDMIMKLTLVRIQIRAYFNSSFFVLTMLMINIKNRTEPIIRTVLKVLLIFIFSYLAFLEMDAIIIAKVTFII